MTFRRRCSNPTDIQAFRAAAAANGAYDPNFEVDSDTPAARSLGTFTGAIFRGVALGWAAAIAAWRAGLAAAEAAQEGD
jgi:hypothetical protein